MSVGETIEKAADATADTFQSLSLSLPVETTKYTFISLFITRMLNLKDESKIVRSDPLERLDSVNDSTASLKKKRPVEILPGISVPGDLWLKDDIVVKDVKIKNSMLHEINSMLDSQLSSVEHFSQPQELDVTALSYYEKLLVAYKFLDIPERDSTVVFSRNSTLDSSLKEEDEDELGDVAENEETFSSPLLGLNQPKRISSFSRDIMSSRKRFLTLLGHLQQQQQQQQGQQTQQTVPEPQEIDEDNKKQQALNHLLAKSRIYNKIKKHRELSGSLNSNNSGSSYSYSNRNSISTTTTASSNYSRRRASSTLSADTQSNKMASQQQVFPKLTGVQKQENQKIKLEYYKELKQLSKLTSSLLTVINNLPRAHGLIRLIEFIKNYVFKFIIIDVSQMIMDYGHLKADEMFRK